MDNPSGTKILVTGTGIPGVGKTELMRSLLGQMTATGVEAHFLNDYLGYMWEWVRENSGRIDLVRLVESTFDLMPAGYEFLSGYVANLVGRDAARLFNEGAQVVIVEAARGAFGVDHYARDLFIPLREAVKNCVGGVVLANIEVTSPVASVVSRAQQRYQQDPTAPPPEVSLKYVDHTGLSWVSSVQELAQGNFGIPVIMNESVVNHNGSRVSFRWQKICIRLCGLDWNKSGVEWAENLSAKDL